ncbi:MAG: beta-lactamase family protein [Planctomycetes bacterium]|nr:beta-lactamase family protein [Planctomycetota bacterium]
MYFILSLIALTVIDSAKMDNIMANYERKGPGVAVAVVSKEEVVYTKGVGYANLDYDIRITPESVFDIGSMAKQFTAACISELVKSGSLTLETDIRKFFPEFQEGVTVGHLLYHTAGVRDYANLHLLMGLWGSKPSSDEVLDLLLAQKRLDFTPGSKHMYSNSGYFLLGRIIEIVSGKSIDVYAEEVIFGPLGMDKTFFNVDENMVIKDRVIGYGADKDGYKMNHSFHQIPAGARGVNSTVLDMAKWQIYLRNAKHLWVEGLIDNETPCGYAFGLEYKTYKDLKTIGHAGYTGSFHTQAVYFPEKDVSIIALANGMMNAGDVVNLLANEMFEITTEEKAKHVEIELPKIMIDQYVGKFTLGANVFEFIMQDDHLAFGPKGQYNTLYPYSENGFFMKTVEVAFEFQDDGSVILFQRGQEHKMMPYVEETEEIAYDDYLGSYVSEELLGSVYRMYEKDDIMFCKSTMYSFPPIDPSAPLKKTDEDTFKYSVMTLRFNRMDGKVNGFWIDSGRANNIWFERQ